MRKLYVKWYYVNTTSDGDASAERWDSYENVLKSLGPLKFVVLTAFVGSGASLVVSVFYCGIFRANQVVTFTQRE